MVMNHKIAFKLVVRGATLQGSSEPADCACDEDCIRIFAKTKITFDKVKDQNEKKL